jgi:hypothetical protein
MGKGSTQTLTKASMARISTNNLNIVSGHGLDFPKVWHRAAHRRSGGKDLRFGAVSAQPY